jgi:integrase
MTVNFDVLCEGFLAKKAVLPDGSENPRIGEIQNRLLFWAKQFGQTPVTSITPEMVDQALYELENRPKLRPIRNKASVASNERLSPATIARYFSELAGLFKYAKKNKSLGISRSWVAPSRGADLPTQDDPDTRYFDSEQVANLIAVARMLDRRWGRMVALIEVAFCTGLRSGNLKALDWRDIDLLSGVVTVDRTKNGDPVIAPLSTSAKAALERIPSKTGLVFGGKDGKAYHWRKLWIRVTDEAGFKGYNFHLLRHSCGSAMAKAGVSQANIMSIMGHRSLAASRRYMHLNVAGKQDVVSRVFG